MDGSRPICVAQAKDRGMQDRLGLNGWVRGCRRASDGYRFDLYDRTGSLPALWDPTADDDMPPPAESAVRACGRIQMGDRGEAFLAVEWLEVVNPASQEDPAPPARYIELRDRARFQLFAIQTTLEAAMREFAIEHGFIELHTPKISGGGSESGANVFSLDYFGEMAYLVQSPQFYMQMAMVAGFDRVFEIGPVFRSEPGRTPVHATEFTIAHFEMAWIDSHYALIEFEEELLRYAIDAVVDEHGDEIEAAFEMPAFIPVPPIPRFSIGEEATKEAGRPMSEASLRPLERALAKRAQREFGHSLAYLVDYPAAVRPFYTMSEEGPPGVGVLSRSFDLLWHGIEITSGGQREHRFERLEEQVASAGIEQSVCDGYIRPHFLEMFRFGAPPHGGFGVGLNRLMMSLLGEGSIRDTSFVFRDPRSCLP